MDEREPRPVPRKRLARQNLACPSENIKYDDLSVKEEEPMHKVIPCATIRAIVLSIQNLIVRITRIE
jgi:hypothetical protein